MAQRSRMIRKNKNVSSKYHTPKPGASGNRNIHSISNPTFLRNNRFSRNGRISLKETSRATLRDVRFSNKKSSLMINSGRISNVRNDVRSNGKYNVNEFNRRSGILLSRRFIDLLTGDINK